MKEYLGEGVSVEMVDGKIVLTTVSACIFISSETWTALLHWLAKQCIPDRTDNPS